MKPELQKAHRRLGGFLRIALKDFSHVATICPSSPWATRSVLKRVHSAAQTVVEYGPGNGVLTRKLLTKLRYDGRLIAIEVNKSFVPLLQSIPDPRLEVVAGDVVQMAAKLRERFPDGVDTVVSGIPFSFLSSTQREAVVRFTRLALRPGGRFVVYQNSPKMMTPLSAHFPKVDCSFEPRNIFPYFIMVATC